MDVEFDFTMIKPDLLGQIRYKISIKENKIIREIGKASGCQNNGKCLVIVEC